MLLDGGSEKEKLLMRIILIFEITMEILILGIKVVKAALGVMTTVVLTIANAEVSQDLAIPDNGGKNRTKVIPIRHILVLQGVTGGNYVARRAGRVQSRPLGRD